jgi:hypothetical protein
VALSEPKRAAEPWPRFENEIDEAVLPSLTHGPAVRGTKMTDEPLAVLVVRKMPDGTFAVADASENPRIVQDGFKSAAEAEKFIEDFYLARGIIRPRK